MNKAIKIEDKVIEVTDNKNMRLNIEQEYKVPVV